MLEVVVKRNVDDDDGQWALEARHAIKYPRLHRHSQTEQILKEINSYDFSTCVYMK